MTTSPINAFFGFTIIPVSEYQDLVSGNQTKSDRIDNLTDANIGLRDRLRTATEGKKLAEARLYDTNERINYLEQENKSFENTRIRNLAQINSLRLQVEELAQGDRANNEIIDRLNAEIFNISQELQKAQKDLDAIQENYRKTLSANADLDKKLSEAIANLSAAELQCNEQTVKIATLQASRDALLQDFDTSKRAVNIELDNHRIAILNVIDELERSLRNPSVME